MQKIVLLGSGGHAKSVVDTIEQSGRYEIAGFLETSDKQNFPYKGYRVIGNDDKMQELFLQGIRYAFITIGYLGKTTARERLYKKVKKIGFQLPVLIDPTATVTEDAIIEEGTFIGKNVVVNAEAQIGKMCIINTGAIIEHECDIGEYSHIAVGAVLCGTVQIGEGTLIGANATIIQGVKIGKQVIIGAGSVVLQKVEDYSKLVGNPAREISFDKEQV